jgi:hypothetical protein
LSVVCGGFSARARHITSGEAASNKQKRIRRLGSIECALIRVFANAFVGHDHHTSIRSIAKNQPNASAALPRLAAERFGDR